MLLLLRDALIVREVVGVLHPAHGVREVHVAALKVRGAEAADGLPDVQLKQTANSQSNCAAEMKDEKATMEGQNLNTKKGTADWVRYALSLETLRPLAGTQSLTHPE